MFLEISGTCGLMHKLSKVIPTSRPLHVLFPWPQIFLLVDVSFTCLGFQLKCHLHREAVTRYRFCGARGWYNLGVSLKKGARNHKYKFILKSEHLFKIRKGTIKNNKFKNVASTINAALIVLFPCILWLHIFF